MLKKAAEAAAFMGVDFIGMMKTNTKGFCKDTIKGLTKYWPDGSYKYYGVRRKATTFYGIQVKFPEGPPI